MRFSGLLALVALVGCEEDSICREPENGDLVARISAPVTLRKAVLRTRESTVGSMAADSILAGFNGQTALSAEVDAASCEHAANAPQRCIDLAVVNAGGLREESACGERGEWREGELYQRDLEQLQPFDNTIVAIGVTGRQLYEAFEQGVSFLGQPGRFSWGGGFLHVAGAQVMIDCGGQPRLTDDDGHVRNDQIGQRVVGICTRYHGDTPDTERGWEMVRRDDDDGRIYRVGVNEFLAGGGDSFQMWVSTTADGTTVPQTLVEPASPGTDQSLFEAYLRALGNDGQDEFDPIARTRTPNAPSGACVWQVGQDHPGFDELAADPLCSREGNHLNCAFDPSSRLTLLRRNLCYP